MATTAVLGPQEWKELERFVKFLTLKTIQVIVQSRRGEKSTTSYRQYDVQPDWFNLAIKDQADVHNNSKRFLSSHQSADSKFPICVEISLSTSENESMVLERWYLSTSGQSDPASKVMYSVYNRMGLLLKSLLCVTRALPAYFIARKQGTDYRLNYRLYSAPMTTTDLGEGHRSVYIGNVVTPIHTLVLSVSYRTQLTLPHRTSTTTGTTTHTGLLLKSDHYQAQDNAPSKQSSAPWSPPLPCKKLISSQLESVSSGDSSNDLSVSPTHPSRTRCARRYSIGSDPPESLTLYSTPLAESRLYDVPMERAPVAPFSGGEAGYNINIMKRAAFAPNRPPLQFEMLLPETLPFSSLFHAEAPSTDTHRNQSSQQESATCDDVDNRTAVEPSSGGEERDTTMTRTVTTSQVGEDFVMVDLRPAFADNDAATDITQFFREFQMSPQLSLFTEQPTIRQTMATLPEQLAIYEQKASEFDEFLEALPSNS